MKRPKKKELLGHYGRRKPKRFIQYDGFADVEADYVMQPDKDGDTFFCRETYELMRGSQVRVFLDPDASDETVLRLLVKIRDWVVMHGVYDPSKESDLREPDIGALEASLPDTDRLPF
jgi:hypothetical protein